VTSVEESFESPRLLLSGAREEFNRLKDLFDAFFLKDRPYRIVFDDKSHPAKVVCYAEILKKPTAEMRLSTYRTVNDLRNALDQALYGAAVALGQTKLSNVWFPFRENPRDLEHVFTRNGRCSDVPVELHALLRSFEPYPRGNGYSGGDSALRDLGRIANPNKHSVALRIGLEIQGLLKMGILANNGAVRAITPTWNRSENKLSLFELIKSTTFNYDIEFPTFVAFDESTLAGVSV
jgi:hypothetical protein